MSVCAPHMATAQESQEKLSHAPEHMSHVWSTDNRGPPCVCEEPNLAFARAARALNH